MYHHFSDYLQVRKQANLHVPESVPPNANKKRKHFMCDLCGAEFPDSYYNKTRHMAIKHQIYLGNKYTCDTCGKVCWSKYDFHKHKQIHSDEAPHTWWGWSFNCYLIGAGKIICPLFPVVSVASTSKPRLESKCARWIARAISDLSAQPAAGSSWQSRDSPAMRWSTPEKDLLAVRYLGKYRISISCQITI